MFAKGDTGRTYPKKKILRVAIAGSLITVLSLFGGTLLGVVIGNVVFSVLPGHSITNLNPVHVLIAAVPALARFLGGSALWGILMGRVAHAQNSKRMGFTGMLGFAPIALGLGIALQILEPIAVQNLGAQFPIQRLFTFFFIPTAFLISGVSAFAIGIGLQMRALAWKLFWRVGLAAAIAFLIVNLAMEALGWQVGAPHAAERFTMLTVMFAGDFAAVIAGGAVMGSMLVTDSPRAKVI